MTPTDRLAALLHREMTNCVWDNGMRYCAPNNDHGAARLTAAGVGFPAPADTPSVIEWLEHAKHGVQSLSDLYHEGGADGTGITVKEFRAGCNFIWEQIDAALRAALKEPTP